MKKATVITPAPYYASSVDSYNQGLKKDNITPVDAIRSVPEQGLVFETDPYPYNFFSLGFGGWIIVKFDCPVQNGEGDDIRIIEDTWSTYPLEKADVWASQDGTTWTYLGEADNTNDVGIHTISEFDLGILNWAKYIKIEDTCDPTLHTNAADGYDLNAVESLQDCVEIQEETAWGAGFGFPGKNWATYFTYDVQGILTGTWLLAVNEGAFMHDMFIVIQDSSGVLTGTGGYPASVSPYSITWVLINSSVTDSGDVVLTLDYDGSSYEATLTGTVDPDWDRMSGGLGTGGVTSWVATRQP